MKTFEYIDRHAGLVIFTVRMFIVLIFTVLMFNVRVAPSVAVVAETSLRTPQKIHFYYQKIYINWIKVYQKIMI